MLPQLREIEHRFESEVVVVGVHAGKYLAERVTARIHDAFRRLGVSHPVVNDRQFRIWRGFAVRVRGLAEPAGLAIGAHFVYVADTNAHRIAIVDLDSAAVEPLIIDNVE